MGAQGAVTMPPRSVSARTQSNTPQSNGEGNEGHEGSSGTKGDEEEGSHEGHEGDEEEGGHEGHEGDEEEGGHEGHEGDEEEVREQDCKGQDGLRHGAPWNQGEDSWWLDGKGPLQEQARQHREQETLRPREEVAMDPGCREGAQGLEDHGLLRDQEGHTPLRKGQGVLQCVSAALSEM